MRNLQQAWWYRLLTVIYIGSIILYFLLGIVITGAAIIDEKNDYKYALSKHEDHEKLLEETKKQFSKYGEMIPVIDSLQGLSSYDKGLEAAKLTRKNNSGRYYIDSLNHNGYHTLEKDEVAHFTSIEKNLTNLEISSSYKSEPEKPNKIIRNIILGFVASLIAGPIIFWLVRRLFYYIVVGDKFFKL